MKQIGVGVSAAVFRNGQVLLVRRASGGFAGRWSLPGGKVEFGEKLPDAALRELFEETALTGTVEAGPVVFEHTPDPELDAHWLINVFAVAAEGEPIAGEDAADVQWVPLGEVEGRNTTPRLYETLIELRRLAGFDGP